MNATSETLRQWEIPAMARFENTPKGLVRLVVTTGAATAHIYLHGAHVTHFQPTDSEPLLFLSSASLFESGKPIRGGVPVIFPWFGPRSGHPESPAHGFARTLPWEVEKLSSAGNTVEVTLCLSSSEATRTLWPHEFVIRHTIVIGRRLEMTLEVENTGSDSFEFEEALHTYLAVADAKRIDITGLAGCEYIDKVDGGKRKVQDTAPIQFTGETDRVYVDTKGACILADLAGGRSIEVSKDGSDTTVIWNPWIAKSAAMSDFCDDEWPLLACIETANANKNAIVLKPGAGHAMTAVIGVEQKNGGIDK